ncbi:hypothetical protein E2562_022664 [Oryza meyeriana var. granulata]|uniref:DUF4005 domain-containing protein n=1 Tax=Oryza meyeriana var. granulata TaxID=110450 RepID=A0A6G1DZW6_9ORYZ|nr:hypothetical protein E2562_022664 [Oryza meyeriana var. granulata]KAF0918070.1 hypothetical protein E2562_022664 [Oryza meyeriana var. granulata]KAF0918071.1 hypothetical protein E2562_022664 [Oryza meyeriana var. granulata]KAF0918072.1 hypothetical protein E2562_022664 [Oryza meyeriana var. granulata]KAF0918073.1 hypothetical protein E2562_022664 [Oryza meyeriana var. granulata]
MGKSPAKWIKSLLLGKKSTKSNSTKAKDLSKAANNKPALSENPPVISESVVVNSHNDGTASTIGNAENCKLPNGGAVEAMGHSVENQNIVGSKTPPSPGKLSEELAAVKAQAAFRGYLARRAFRALKGIIRLQALIRGHLVRRQAASTLRATWLIVKLQALARGRNVRLSSASMQIVVKSGQHKFMNDKPSDAWKEKVSSNAYVRKLLSSSVVLEALHFKYDERDPNSLHNWLERWTISRIWKSASQPKKVADGKPQVRKASYAMETESAKLKRNVRKSSAVTVDSFQTNMTVEPEKLKRNSRKFSSSAADSVPDSQLSELEKVKRNLRKVTNSMAEASKISSSRADASKVCSSMSDASKVSSSMADASKVSNSMADASKESDSMAQIPPSLVNGISGHQDNQYEEAQENARTVPPDTQELHRGNLLEDNSHMNLLEPDLISNPETPFASILTWEKFNDTTTDAQVVEVLPLQNIDNEDNFLGKEEQPRSKEEPLSNGSLKTNKRRSSFTKSDYLENGAQNTPVPRRKPSYMAATESAKAKLRGQNSPRLDSDSSADMNGFTRRQSLPSATNNRAIKAEWRR